MSETFAVTAKVHHPDATRRGVSGMLKENFSAHENNSFVAATAAFAIID